CADQRPRQRPIALVEAGERARIVEPFVERPAAAQHTVDHGRGGAAYREPRHRSGAVAMDCRLPRAFHPPKFLVIPPVAVPCESGTATPSQSVCQPSVRHPLPRPARPTSQRRSTVRCRRPPSARWPKPRRAAPNARARRQLLPRDPAVQPASIRPVTATGRLKASLRIFDGPWGRLPQSLHAAPGRFNGLLTTFSY